MAVRQDAREPKENDLSGLAYMDLVEMLVNENRTYRDNLSAIDTAEERRRITDEYLQRIKPIKEEGARREQLYLEGHRANVRYTS